MKIRRKHLFLFISISLCGILYIFHCVQLNSYYQKLDTVRDEIYYIGQEISLGENNIGGSMQANGYSIRVNGLKIADTKDYIEKNNISLEGRGSSLSERLALVPVTVRNVNSNNTGVPVLLFELYGIDFYAVVDFELFYSLNPDVESATWGVFVPQGSEQEILIPFRLDRDEFNSHTWNRLDNYHFSVLLTTGPARIIVRLEEVHR